jgi:hypothetical protein
MIAVFAEGEERIELMIAVRAACPHMKREVNLGVGGFLFRRRGGSH